MFVSIYIRDVEICRRYSIYKHVQYANFHSLDKLLNSINLVNTSYIINCLFVFISLPRIGSQVLKYRTRAIDVIKQILATPRK